MRERPQNEILAWGDDCMGAEEPWGTGWIDVRVPEIERDLNSNWTFTVLSPDDDETESHPDAFWNFAVPHDLDVHCVFDPEPPNQGFIGEFAVPRGTEPPPEQEKKLQELLKTGQGCERIMRGGWSADAITAALNTWVATHAHRPDITFRWDPALPPSEMLQRAKAAQERVEKGEETLHDLRDGVFASEEAMDFLLRDPDEAAKILRRLKGLPGKS